MFLALAGAFVVFATAAVAQATFPEEISLPNGFRPEGISIGNGSTFYVGSIPTGAIYRGDLRTGEGGVLVPGVGGRAAIGTKFDRGLLYVAGWRNRQGIRLRRRDRCARARGAARGRHRSDLRQRRGRHQGRRVLHRLAAPGALPAAARERRRARHRRDGRPGRRRWLHARASPREQPERDRCDAGREDARRRADRHGEALPDRRGHGRDDGDRPRRRDARERGRHPPPRADALRRPEPLQSDRGRVARPGPRLGVA